MLSPLEVILVGLLARAVTDEHFTTLIRVEFNPDCGLQGCQIQ